MNSNKKILYLRTDIVDMKVVAGGSVAHTLGVIKGLIDCGHDVVCASSIMISLLKELKLDDLIELKNPSKIKFLRWRLNCILSNFFFSLKILKFIKNKKIDYIYQRYGLLNCVGVILGKLKKIPMILEYNGSEVWIDKAWGKQRKFFKFNRLAKFIENINLKYSSCIVVVSKALKEELVHRGVCACKILVNPNGVDTDRYDSQKLLQERAAIRDRLNIINKFTYGFIGTFNVWHGIKVIGEMIPEIVKRYSNIHFLLIGDGPLLEDLKLDLKNKGINGSFVTFTGMVKQEEGREYLSACDAFLSPTQPNLDGSKFFGSPTKIFEYLSMGKPVIASDLDQLSELIFPAIKTSELHNVKITDQVGCLVHPKDLKGFIDAVCFISSLNDKELNILGFNARKRAIENYRWKDHVKKIIEFKNSI